MLATEHGNGSQQVFDHLKNITQTDWFMNHGLVATWLNNYSVPFSLILTRWGICYNFNMLASSELLNMNEISNDFHYKADVIKSAVILSLNTLTIQSNETAPWNAPNSQRIILISFNPETYQQENPFVEMQGFHMIFHSNFEFPFAIEKNHLHMEFDSFLTIDVIPIVYEADDSLLELIPDQ